MMDRRAFVVGGVASLVGPLAARAQPAGKIHRIGFLSSTGCPIQPDIMGPFRQGLLELGYVEGQNIVIECRGTPRATDRLPGFAAELVLLNVEFSLPWARRQPRRPDMPRIQSRSSWFPSAIPSGADS